MTSDPFEVPATGPQTLLFEYNFTATALLRPVSDVLEFYIATESAPTVWNLVNNVFSDVTLENHAPISGFEQGSGFRTGAVLVTGWAGQRIRIKIVLKGRGVLPEYISGMNADDANPIGHGHNAGTGLFLDNFRISNGVQPALDPIKEDTVSIISDGTVATIAASVGAIPSNSRVTLFDMSTGLMRQITASADGRFTVTLPFSEDDLSASYLLSYYTADADGTNRIYSPSIKLEVVR